jgi:hypothetical protein
MIGLLKKSGGKGVIEFVTYEKKKHCPHYKDKFITDA